MTVSLDEILRSLPEERRRRIEARTAELIAEELHLRELRRLRKLTQTKLSKKLKIGQEGISRMEKRADMYISTLRGYVEGVGGKLSLVVEFPDQQPVILAGLGMNEQETSAKVGKKAGKTTTAKTKSRLKSATKMLQSA